MLNGKVCTTHWKYLQRFTQKYPQILVQKNRLFTDQGRIYISAGVSSGIDLSLYILEKLYGTKFAIDIAKEIVIYFRRGESDTQLSIFLAYRNHINNQIHEAQDYIQSNLSQSLITEELAEKANMSVRNFSRVFKKSTGITVGQFIEKLRVETAVELLSQNNKVEFVANQCVLKSTNQLRSLLKKYKSVLPTELKAG